MSNNRILGNLASYIDSSSDGGAITKSGNDFFIQAMTDSDVGGTPATGFAGTDSASVKGLITTARVVQKSGRSKNAPGLKNVLQGEITKLNPSASATYNLGDSSNPIDEIILDSSATIFFGDISLTSILKSGTSTIAVAAIPVPPSNSSNSSLLLKTDSTQTDAQVDASTNAATITENGNVTSTAFTPYHPGGYSVLFPGGDQDNGYLNMGAAIVPATGSWTFQTWCKVTKHSNGAHRHSLLQFYRNSQTGRGSIEVKGHTEGNPGTVQVYVDGMSAYPISTTRVDDGQWHHVVVERDGNIWNLWIDGVREFQGTQSVTIYTGENTRIGSGVNTVGSNYRNMNGYIRDVRFSTSARYSGSETIDVPTEDETNTTGYSLLCCQSSNPFVDKTGTYTISKVSSSSVPVKSVIYGPYDYFSYSPSSHGGSVYFDGSGDYLSMPSSEGYKFGTGDFTIEGWMYFDTISTSVGQTVIDCWQGTNNYNWLVSFDADTFTFAAGNNGAYSAGNAHNITTSLSDGNWYHFAVTRESSSLRCFINGVQQGSTLSNTANISDNIPVYIGTNQDGGGNPFSGHISDIRIVKGTAVYTADFTPPTEPLTAIAGAELLTCTNKNNIYDISGGTLLTVNGNTTTDTNTTKYSNSSVYFDGTDDHITTNSSAGTSLSMGGEDYTAEGWFYFNTLPSSGNGWKMLFAFRDASAEGIALYVDGPTPHLECYTGSLIGEGTTTLSTGQWYHIAFVRNSDTAKVYINGTEDISYSYSTFVGDVTTGYIAGGTTQNMDGYIEDLRVTKGVARYTANFTPPTAALEG